MRKNAGVCWARVEEDTRQLTVKCTRITDQRVGWVDRWIQVNRFTRPHVPCISAGCEVKSSGEWSSKCRRGWNLPFSKNLPPFVFSPSTNFFETGLDTSSLNFIGRLYFFLYFELSWKKKKTSNRDKFENNVWEDSDRVVVPNFNHEGKREENKNHG